jgi:uncharacterized phiE125 gp8 family phage protein
MRWAIEQSTAPSAEPITKAELREHLRLDNDPEEDALLDGIISASTKWAEEFTGQQFIDATWKLYLDRFPSSACLQLPKPPLTAITSIQYVDTAGTTQTWTSSDYQVTTKSKPGMVGPINTANWPTTDAGTFDAVTITYTAGYGASGSDVPNDIRQALYLVCGHFYEHREAGLAGVNLELIPMGAAALLSNHRRTWFPSGLI